MGRKKKITEHYVDNVEFHSLLVKHRKYVDALIEHFIKHHKVDEETHISTVKLALMALNFTEKDTPELVEIRTKLERIKNRLGRMFIKMCKGYLTKPNFINYTQDRKDDMISDACFYMSKYILKFNIKRKNPFAYFTTTIDRAFKQYINKHKRYTEKFQPLGYIESLHDENSHLEEDWG